MSSEEEAYLLGILLKHALSQKQISEGDESEIRSIVKEHFLSEYYDLKRKPDFDDWSILAIAVCLFGILGVIYGFIMLLSNDYIHTFSTTTLVENIKGGGYLFLLGLIMLIGGFTKAKVEYNRKRLLKYHATN